MSMFCYQCQEAAKGIGCTVNGVCGKSNDLAQMMDVLIYVCKGLSVYTTELKKHGVETPDIDRFIMHSLFKTITNVNFDKESIISSIMEGLAFKRKARTLISSNKINIDETLLPEAAKWEAFTQQEFERKAPNIGVLSTENEDIRSLRELLTYGIKGIAAYAEHAYNLGYENKDIYAFMQKGLAATVDDSLTTNDLISLIMECGKYAVETMALLDKANTSRYGNPEITKVNIGVRNNPGILISGHDLRDLEDLLIQTEGTGIDVYTHCEMLPAHYYPTFKKYKHLVGNYGNAWWKQREELEKFNGPILFTTNCIVPPLPNATYKDRIYTTGPTGLPGVKHIGNRPEGGMKDFSEIIEHAKRCKPPVEIEKGEIIGGFAHTQVLALSDKIIDAIKSGAIKKFIVMAGCDGRMKERNYYTEFAKKLPKDTVILTAGCAKYRYNKLQLGDINGIPRVIDAGQCNDSYSLAVIALKLKELFKLNDINDLPIAYNIAWYEQKAVTVLLALLYLGVKNIHLGPTLPAFLSPNVAKILIDKFGISGITNVDNDLKKFFKLINVS